MSLSLVVSKSSADAPVFVSGSLALTDDERVHEDLGKAAKVATARPTADTDAAKAAAKAFGEFAKFANTRAAYEGPAALRAPLEVLAATLLKCEQAAAKDLDLITEIDLALSARKVPGSDDFARIGNTLRARFEAVYASENDLLRSAPPHVARIKLLEFYSAEIEKYKTVERSASGGGGARLIE